jgi:outer membrane receptor protein involved in Fe transport
VRPISGLTVIAAYTYLRTEILDNGGISVTESPKGAPLVRQPTHGGSLTVAYARDRLTASVTGVFVGERQDVDALTVPSRRVSLPGYARFDAAVSYVLLKDVAHLRALTLFGNARNLTNARYEDFFGFSSPRATFLVGLRASF